MPHFVGGLETHVVPLSKIRTRGCVDVDINVDYPAMTHAT